MTAIAKSFSSALHLPRWSLLHLWIDQRRRRQATIDLLHASPHLLRDIGATEGNLCERCR
jgi:uncharacterized protein YjiS (DUF1127 family)